MSFEKSTYYICEKITEGEISYFASFIDGNGTYQEIKIPDDVFLVLEQCRKHESRQERSIRRHQEQALLEDAQLQSRVFQPICSVEDVVSLTVDMQAALATLTDIQRRRFLLYHEYGLSYELIAKEENLSKQAIAQSISRAEKAIKKFISEGG